MIVTGVCDVAVGADGAAENVSKTAGLVVE